MSDIDLKRLKELMQPDVDPVDAAAGGVWYEPRSLWLVKAISLSDYQIDEDVFGPTLTVQLPRNAFRNGTRFPIEINRIVFSGIGYPLARPDVEAMQNSSPGVGDLNGTSVINTLSFDISAPYRQHYTRSLSIGSGLNPRPTSSPLTSAASGTSSVFGTTTLKFDRPLILPKGGALEWGVSSLQGMRWLDTDSPTNAFNLPSDNLPMTLSVLEQSRVDLLPGAARSVSLQLRTNAGGTAPQPQGDGIPYAFPPGFGLISPAGTQVPFWDPQSAFTANDFRKQNSTRAGSTSFYGMTAAIDQRTFDATVLETFTEATIAPMSTRLGTRIRVQGGPSTEWWWLPGAPLCLTHDTVTPAAVYWLQEPITLAPGDTFQCSVRVRTNANLDSGIAQVYSSLYQFGISFNGFTAMSG